MQSTRYENIHARVDLEAKYIDAHGCSAMFSGVELIKGLQMPPELSKGYTGRLIIRSVTAVEDIEITLSASSIHIVALRGLAHAAERKHDSPLLFIIAEPDYS
jgi:hypothetical protein